MSKFKFFPPDWKPDQRLIDWAHSKGISDLQIAEQLEEIRDHEFNPMRSCPMRTWRRWMRNAIKWGHIVPTVTKEYRQPEQLTSEQRQRDILAFERDPLVRAARRE